MKKTIIAILAAAAMVMAGCGNNGGKENGEKAKQASAQAAIENIMNRKSVRNFTGEKLTEEQITTLLKAAMAAPSAINIQPWRFVVIDDEAIINDLFADGWKPEMFLKAGAIIVVCGETTVMRKPWGKPDAEPVETENIFWYEDCAAATENLLLAAEALGLGATWTAGYPAEDRVNKIAPALGRPENVKPLAIVPVGVPAVDEQPKDKWDPEKIHRNRW